MYNGKIKFVKEIKKLFMEVNILKAEEAWLIIINSLKGKKLEFHTVPKNNKKPLWFTASSDGIFIYIDNAVVNKPSSNLSMVRKLDFKNFSKVFPLYLRRENGEEVSSEVSKVTLNQVYYFSLIKNLTTKNN